MRVAHAAVAVALLAGCDANGTPRSEPSASIPHPDQAVSESLDVGSPVSSRDGGPVIPATSTSMSGPDSDSDGIADGSDNCPRDANRNQQDMCGTTVPPRGGCPAIATVEEARPPEIEPGRVVQVVRRSLDQPGAGPADGASPVSCDEGEPIIIEPDPPGVVLDHTDGVFYVLTTEELAGQPGGGLNVTGAALDTTASVAPTVLSQDELKRVLERALVGPHASTVAAAVAPAAQASLPDIWDQVTAINALGPDAVDAEVELPPSPASEGEPTPSSTGTIGD